MLQIARSWETLSFFFVFYAQQESSNYLAYGAGEQGEPDGHGHGHSPAFYPGREGGQHPQTQQESAYTSSYLLAEAYPHESAQQQQQMGFMHGVYSPAGTYADALAPVVGMDNGMQSVDAFAAYT